MSFRQISESRRRIEEEIDASHACSNEAKSSEKRTKRHSHEKSAVTKNEIEAESEDA